MSVLALLLLWMSPDRAPPTPAAQKPSATLPALEEACRLRPNEGDSCYLLGSTLLLQDRWVEAREPFEKALRVASKTSRARVHRLIAFNYIGLGDTVQAERHFKQAVALNPGPELLRENPRLDYGSFLFREGRLNEALPLLKQAVEAMPNSARAHTEFGRVLLHLGQPELGVIHLEKAVQLDPQFANARLLRDRARALSSAAIR